MIYYNDSSHDCGCIKTVSHKTTLYNTADSGELNEITVIVQQLQTERKYILRYIYIYGNFQIITGNTIKII